MTFLKRDWSQEEINRYLGKHQSCFSSYSTDQEVRSEAASGGTVSQFLINLLEKGVVDGALVWHIVFGYEYPIVKPFIATTKQEILNARGSHYCSVYFSKDAMPIIETFSGKLAIVALPCDTSYLRKKMKGDQQLGKRVACIVTLFCGHNSSPELTRLIVHKIGYKWKDLIAFRHRKGLWRGSLYLKTSEGETIQRKSQSFTHFQNLHFFSDRKCLSCQDHFGYDADISMGDTWLAEMKNKKVKSTVVVTRTNEGRKLFSENITQIESKEITAEEVLEGNSRGIIYHYNITARSKIAAFFGLKISDRQKLRVTPLDIFTAFLGIFNYWISKKNIGNIMLQKVPFFIINLYVYFFKGLQQLNVFFSKPKPQLSGNKISLIGATLSGNRGAEAMLVATIYRVREFLPDAEFVIHSYFPKEDKTLCNDLDVKIVNATPKSLVLAYFPFSLANGIFSLIGLKWSSRLMPSAVRELAESRVLLDVSGIAFSDGREKFLPFNILNNWPAMMLGVPVVRLAQALGPFKNLLNRLCAKWMLKNCEHIFARGVHSYEYCEQLGMRGNLSMALDIAFCLKPNEQISEENTKYLEKTYDRVVSIVKEKPLIVLSVSAVLFKKCEKNQIDYIELMITFCRYFLEKDMAVLLYPNASRDGSNSFHNNDIPIIKMIKQKVDDEFLVAIEKGLNARGLKSILKHGDYLIASRFHAMIAGLSLKKPTMVIGWGHKYTEVVEQFGIEEWVFDFKNMKGKQFLSTFDQFIQSSQEIQTQIESHWKNSLLLANAQFTWLKEYLSDNVKR